MPNPIGWEAFFDFNSSNTLKDAEKQLDSFESKITGMAGAVVESNERIAESMTEVKDAANSLAAAAGKLNPAMTGSENALAGLAKESEDLVKTFSALKVVEGENAKLLADLTKTANELAEAKKKLKDNNTAEAGSYDDLRQRLSEAEKAYKAMGTATDSAVKDEALAKVRGLSVEFKNVSGALGDAKKGAVAAAGSYNELAARVAAAKKQLKDMEGGLDGNSKEFKELQKFASEGTKTLKEWDNAVGDNQRKVGDYAGELGKISPALGSLVSGIDGATKASLAFIATPLGATLALIAGAIAAVTAYFNSSIEGQDDLNSVVQVGIALFEGLMDIVEEVGEALFKAASEPGKAWDALTASVREAWAAIKEAPLDVLKSFGQAILDNVINRFTSVGVAAAGLMKILKGEFAEGFKQIGNSYLQFVTGVENVIDKATDAFKPFVAALNERLKLAAEIAALENQLRKDRIADILDDAKTELAVTKLLVEAKDKLRFTDEERFNKLRQANTLLEDQLKGDLKLAQDEIRLQQLIIKQEGETYEERQKLVELQAKEIELQTQFFQARKNRQTEEINLIREVEKEIIDSRKRMQDAENAYRSVVLSDQVKQNDAILAEENSSLQDRLQAIAANDAAQLQLIKQGEQAELDASKESALARVQLDADTIDAIYNQTDKSLSERIALERDAKEELLVGDQAYTLETLKIMEDSVNKQNDLLKKSTKLAEDNVFKVLARDAAIMSATIDETQNNALTALNEAFAAGDIDSIEEYEQRKLDIQRKAQDESIRAQIEYLTQRKTLLQEGSRERQDVETAISKLELKLSEEGAAQRLQYEQELQAGLAELKQVAFEGAVTIIENMFEAEEMDRERRSEKLDEQMQAELALVGDNAEAKSKIENEYAAKQRQIELEQAAAMRKRAIFQKALGITEVAINTAKGIGQALGAFPPPASIILAAVVAAIGAVQIAAIASKPIPAFAKGTKDSPEGWAIINEQGPERVVTRSGQEHTIYSDGPTLAYIPRHSKIYTADETEKLEEMEAYQNNLGNVIEGKKAVVHVHKSEDSEVLVAAMASGFRDLSKTVKNKRETHVNFTKDGLKFLMKNAQATEEFLDQFFS